MKNDYQEATLVSVVMASFNEPSNIIGEAIDSILAQTYGNFELLIIDDSTNEETIHKLNSYNDPRIRLVRQGHHAYLPEKLNVGLKMARGKYIARMDADDIALKERFEKQVDFLEKHSNIYVIGGQVNLMDESGYVFSEKKYPLKGLKLYMHSTYKSPFNHPSTMFRKELIDSGFLYNESLTKTSEDIDLWLRIIHEGYGIANLPIKVTNYRVREKMAQWRSSKKEIEYMAYVRKKTFSIKCPIHSLLSFVAGRVFLLIPQKAVTKMYIQMYKK
ncbi:glycosyltransferase family 2 protein [Butyrivibrio sp. XPD2002]|uniref:glycosyltransferase family 2 protein n=1 Tax=Butyrivibrio sp. XPD2002 TaxID=1280665 RepID=UPI0004002587|nr:glycosyltransferase [Butyrivibrio sp. XPD2002]